MPVRRQQIIGAVVDAAEGDHRAVFIALGGVIEYDIQNDLDPVPVELPDQIFQLIGLQTDGTG